MANWDESSSDYTPFEFDQHGLMQDPTTGQWYSMVDYKYKTKNKNPFKKLGKKKVHHKTGYYRLDESNLDEYRKWREKTHGQRVWQSRSSQGKRFSSGDLSFNMERLHTERNPMQDHIQAQLGGGLGGINDRNSDEYAEPADPTAEMQGVLKRMNWWNIESSGGMRGQNRLASQESARELRKVYETGRDRLASGWGYA